MNNKSVVVHMELIFSVSCVYQSQLCFDIFVTILFLVGIIIITFLLCFLHIITYVTSLYIYIQLYIYRTSSLHGCNHIEHY